jgi:hypothetical protein
MPAFGLMIGHNDRWSLSRRETGRARVAALRGTRAREIRDSKRFLR